MIFNVATGGTASAGSWKFVTATAKPDAVAKRTMLAVCEIAPATITVADAQPATPAENDVWFHIANPSDGQAMSDGSVPIKCYGAYQYASSAWSLLTAYYAYCGVWWELPGLPALDTPLTNCTWAQIDRIGAAGKAADYFCVGDEKAITLSTAEVITLQILGFGHDDLLAAGGGKAPITFGFKSCMNANQPMNATNTNVGGYSGCALYQTINGAIYNSLPAELRTVMKVVSKRTSAGNQAATIVTTQEKLFLLSEVEIFGSSTHTRPGEGTRYAFFTNGGARVKTVGGTASAWWERSPYSATAEAFGAVPLDGASAAYSAPNALGVALAFCV